MNVKLLRQDRESEAKGRRPSQVLVLGGGPAGLATCYYSLQAGLSPVLFEKSSQIGGAARTLRCGSHRFDSGAHRFHDRDPAITEEVRRLLGGRLHPVDSPSRILDQGQWVDFPPTPLNMLSAAGPRQAIRIAFELLGTLRSRKDEFRSFRDLAVGRFGETLAQHYLIRYTEKVWGLRADQLSPRVATRRLRGMSLQTLLFEVLGRSRKSAHLDGEFLYPDGGFGKIVEALAASFPRNTIRSDEAVRRLVVKQNRVIALETSRTTQTVSGEVIATIPITALVRSLAEWLPTDCLEAANDLRFRDLRTLFLRIDRSRVTENASIYFPEPAYVFSRISEPRNRCRTMAPANETSLLVEIPCFAQDAVAGMSDEDLAEKVIEQLSTTHLVRPEEVLEWKHHRIRAAYPIYDLETDRRLETVLGHIEPIENLRVIGRAGRFFYSHLHDQMAMARDTIERLVADQVRDFRHL